MTLRKETLMNPSLQVLSEYYVDGKYIHKQCQIILWFTRDMFEKGGGLTKAVINEGC